MSRGTTSRCQTKGPLESLKGKGGGGRKFEEIMAKNIPDLMKTIHSQIQKAQQTPSTRNMKSAPRDIMIKLLKINGKGKILIRGKRHVTYKETKIKMALDF